MWRNRLTFSKPSPELYGRSGFAPPQPSDNQTHLHLSNQEICPTNGVRCIKLYWKLIRPDGKDDANHEVLCYFELLVCVTTVR